MQGQAIQEVLDPEDGGSKIFLSISNYLPDSYNESQQDALFLKFILIKNSICFGQIYCPSSEVSTLYTQQ